MNLGEISKFSQKYLEIVLISQDATQDGGEDRSCGDGDDRDHDGRRGVR